MIHGVHNYYVKVSGSSSAGYHVFYISTDGISGSYLETPELEFCEYQTYYFHQTDASNSGQHGTHPFRFGEGEDGPWNQGGVEYTDGVTITGDLGKSGAYTSIEVQEDASILNSALYFYCANHTGMGGTGYIGVQNNQSCGHEPLYWTADHCEDESLLSHTFRRYSGDTQNVWPNYLDYGHVKLNSGSGCWKNVEPATTIQDEVSLSLSWHNSCEECASDGVCTVASGLSGKLTELIFDTNQELSGQYASFTTTSYSIATGYHTGSFQFALMSATGLTAQDAEARRSIFETNFLTSGFFQREWPRSSKATGMENINNINVSVSGTDAVRMSDPPSGYVSYSRGYSDKEHYVTYTPTISGRKKTVSVDVNCPDTSLEIRLERDAYVWDSTGIAGKDEEMIRNIDVTLGADCTGYQTSLTSHCDWVRDGKESFCEKEVFNGATNCWSESDFDRYTIGNYEMIYKSGSFETSTNKHIIGTGNLVVKKYV